ncbi:MAG: sarcosine oxidase subunit gamma family protein [Pseudomonadota bacterium]
MSDPASPAADPSTGAAPVAQPLRLPGLEIVWTAPAPPAGLVSLRADLTDPAVEAALVATTGLSVPGVRRATTAGDAAALWFSPDEFLLLLPDAARSVVGLGEALHAVHHLVADTTDARCRVRIAGPSARDLLARGIPVDLAPEAFGPGDLRRTRLGQLAAAVWCEEAERFSLFCHRSVAEHVAVWLATAASSGSAGLYGAMPG